MMQSRVTSMGFRSYDLFCVVSHFWVQEPANIATEVCDASVDGNPGFRCFETDMF